MEVTIETGLTRYDSERGDADYCLVVVGTVTGEYVRANTESPEEWPEVEITSCRQDGCNEQFELDDDEEQTLIEELYAQYLTEVNHG